MITRIARPEDFDAVYSMLLEMHAENAHFPLHAASAQETIRQNIAHGFCVVLEKAEPKCEMVASAPPEIIGSCGLFTNRVWYSDAPYLTDYWFFIREPHRNALAATLLLNSVRAFAREKSLPLVLGLFINKEADRKDAFFSRHLTKIGGFYLDEAS